MDRLETLLVGLPPGQYAFQRDGNGNVKPVLLALEVDEETIMLGAKPYVEKLAYAA